MEPQESQRTLIDPMRPFSESKLWDLQQAYYQEEGIKAFSSQQVPHYITNSPQTAKHYAEMVFGFLRDLGRQGQDHETVYLVELGAGPGKLCHHFLHYFNRFLSQTPEAIPPFTYVLTDLPGTNLEFWRSHPRLKEFVKKGILDFAEFNAVEDDKIHLLESGKTLEAGCCQQPLIVIANYFFDVLPQELVYIESGSSYQVTLSLSTDQDPATLTTGQLLPHLELKYGYDLLDKSRLPESMVTLLQQYETVLNESHVLLPHVGIACMERLEKISPEGLLILTGDKGITQLKDLDQLDEPELVLHGSASFYLNFQALGAHCLHKNGRTFLPAKHKFNLIIGAFLFAENPVLFPSFARAYEQWVSHFGPDESYIVKRVLEKGFDDAELEEMIALLRYFLHDAKIFQALYSSLEACIPNLNDKGKDVLTSELLQVWDNYYALDEEEGIEPALKKLLLDLGHSETLMTTFP